MVCGRQSYRFLYRVVDKGDSLMVISCSMNVDSSGCQCEMMGLGHHYFGGPSFCGRREHEM